MDWNEPVTHACPSEAELRRYHAQELSAAEQRSIRGHLDVCAACAERAAALLNEHNSWVERLRAARPAVEKVVEAPPRPSAPLGPDDIAGYEILEEIRRGGQGIVFRAIQKSTKRAVALKVLLEGPYASEATRRRFEREIEIVAGLSHPHIVTVFDSGETRDGRKYFAMDYVRGQRLDHFIATRSLSLADGLSLFSRVCQAINYAHQRGVIHRDLKPSNVLVDDNGEPHVLDFGLARPVAQAEATVMTTTGSVAGTLPYMSPEQARGMPDAVDVRSDVYALGVMLYELLTGTYPYPVEGDTIQVLKHIAETPPTPPSRAWRRSADGGARGSQAAGRAFSARWANEELETIVLTALAKEREQRYQTAGAFARDIDHFLAGEPIEAKGDSGWYVLKKMLYRYRVGAGIATAFAGVILVGLVVSLTLWRTAVRERDAAQHAQTLAEAAETKARERFGQLRALAKDLIFGLDPKISHLPGSVDARQFLVEKTLVYLDALARDAEDNLSLQRELAGAWITVGDVQGDLASSHVGDLHGALESYQEGLAILQRLAAVEGDDVSLATQNTMMLNLLKIGDAHAGLGEQDRALESYRQALEIGERALLRLPNEKSLCFQLADAHGRIAANLQGRGDLDGALAHVHAGMRRRKEAVGEGQDRPELAQRLAADHFRIGQIHQLQGRLGEALDSYRLCLALSEEFVRGYPEHIYARRCVAISHQWIGITLSDMGEHAAAVGEFRECLAIIEGLLRDDPDSRTAQIDLAETCLEFGETQLALGQRAQARARFERALGVAETLAQSGYQPPQAARLQGAACRNMGRLNLAYAQDEATPPAERVQRWQAARDWLRRALDVFADLRKQELLAPSDAGVPDELAAEIERCHQAIAELRPPEH